MQGRRTRLCKFTLEVKAKGYWFTSGGEKGSFGYYPHLKKVMDGREYPIYPDTQVHGDLKMAAFWLSKIQSSEFDEGFVSYVFGDKNQPSNHTRQPSKVFVTDLELKDRSQWSDSLFQIKPRIEVTEDRTVREHMLVSLEMAYLEGQILASTIYLYGDFTDEEFDRAKRLINESTKLLSGFGAFRSRGYGRGEITLREEPISSPSGSIPEAQTYVISLTSLVNFRNRQIYPGTEQTLKTEPYISSDKIKAWLCWAYVDHYGKWPDHDDISSVEISPLYPRPSDQDTLFYPAPATTLRDEAGRVFDLAGSRAKEEIERENLFNTKASALPQNVFVSDEAEPKTYELPIHLRVRNSIDESFKTLKEGGLFVQEYIPAGVIFCGTISFSKGSPIQRKILSILTEKLPVINGCLFMVDLKPVEAQEVKSGKPLLVTDDIPFAPEDGLINYASLSGRASDGANLIRLSTKRAYNTMLNRQRRPRIVIKSGSVINSPSLDLLNRYRSKLCSWQGFGRVLESLKPPAESRVALKRIRVPKNEIDEIRDALIGDGMTRSQAGFLRGYLNEKQNIDFLKKLTADRIEKYERKGLQGFKALYEKLESYLNSGDLLLMRIFIEGLLDSLYTYWWDKRIKG